MAATRWPGLAWPEVYFTGQGWVPFDPTPSGADAAGQDDGTKREILDRIGQNQPPPSQPPPKPAATATTGSVAAAGGGGRAAGGPREVAPITGAVALILLTALVAGRAGRRLRHRRAGPRGAWSEVLDLLVLLGHRPAGSRTATGIADDLAAAVPAIAPAIYRLADQADRATFAPRGTPVASPSVALQHVRRAVRRAAPWYRRATWSVDPRPFLRR